VARSHSGAPTRIRSAPFISGSCRKSHRPGVSVTPFVDDGRVLTGLDARDGVSAGLWAPRVVGQVRVCALIQRDFQRLDRDGLVVVETGDPRSPGGDEFLDRGSGGRRPPRDLVLWCGISRQVVRTCTRHVS
jgi:hypothetical protein